jgi:hypothetical protein
MWDKILKLDLFSLKNHSNMSKQNMKYKGCNNLTSKLQSGQWDTKHGWRRQHYYYHTLWIVVKQIKTLWNSKWHSMFARTLENNSWETLNWVVRMFIPKPVGSQWPQQRSISSFCRHLSLSCCCSNLCQFFANKILAILSQCIMKFLEFLFP